MSKTNRCRICKTRKGTRFCLRIGKEICWHCCNEKRVDFKCPESCYYSLIKNQNASGFFEYKTNVDSKVEFDDLLINEIKVWIRLPQDVFQGKIPIRMAETEKGKKELEDFFGSFSLINKTPLFYLKKELKLSNLKVISQEENHETSAMKFLDKVIEQDWEKTTSLLFQNQQYDEEKFFSNYVDRMTTEKIIRRMTFYELISSALTKDKNRALVYFEIDGKYELTLSLILKSGKWKVEKMVFGKPELYTGEQEMIRQIGVLLSKNQLSQAHILLKKYEKIYFDSADLKYFMGLYHLFTKNFKKAKKFFFDAIEIDPNFLEAKHNFAYILHLEHNISEAKKLYKEILAAEAGKSKSKEDELRESKVLNNLASIYIEEKNYSEAEKLLKQILEKDENFELAKKNLERLEEIKES